MISYSIARFITNQSSIRVLAYECIIIQNIDDTRSVHKTIMVITVRAHCYPLDVTYYVTIVIRGKTIIRTNGNNTYYFVP